MNDEKKELKVAALENGTVIDHIPSSQLFKVVSILGLENCTNSITIGNNLASKKIGKKGIIKVADRFFKEEDLNKIALVAPAAQINIIRDYQVIEKRKVSLPDIVHGIIRCGNPKYRTNGNHISSNRQNRCPSKMPLLRTVGNQRRNRNLLILPIYETKLETRDYHLPVTGRSGQLR